MDRLRAVPVRAVRARARAAAPPDPRRRRSAATAPMSRSIRPLAFLVAAVAIALGGIGTAHEYHHELHEHHELPPILHFGRDAALALPFAVVAVLAATVLCLAVLRHGRSAATSIGLRLLWALSAAGVFAALSIPGNELHGRLFAAEHTLELGWLEHALRDAGFVFAGSAIAAALVAVTIGPPWPTRRLAAWPRASRPSAGLLVPVARRVGAAFLGLAVLASPMLPFPTPAFVPPVEAVEPGVAAECVRTVTADVVALDQPFYYNRLGAINANGMIYALARDVVVNAGVAGLAGRPLSELTDAERETVDGQVSLRADKRPRPLTLRVNEGDCLAIHFTNLLDPVGFIFDLPADFPTDPILGLGVPINQQVDNQPLTRVASIHVDGLELVNGIADDGSRVGRNPAGSSVVAPGFSTDYTYYAPDKGTHLLYSMGTTLGAEGDGGTRSYGLFGAVNVEPGPTGTFPGSLWYRSQLTRQEMDWATPPETFTDWNANGTWDAGIAEPLTDWNENGVQDNGIAEPLTDWNENGVQDNGIAEPLTDWNENGVQDNGIAEPFTDVDGGTPGVYDLGEPFTDWNESGAWDASVDEPFTDWNESGAWDASVDEPFTDWNESGAWDASVDEPFTDWNESGAWDASVDEPLVDTNGDGIWNAHQATPGGQPILDYFATYPLEAGPAKAGLPILSILTPDLEIIHSDLNAIVDDRGFPYPDNQAYPNRGEEPFREFTVIFHDEGVGVQAFPGFYNDPVLRHTLHGVVDAFPINYGSGGIGSEIIANRLGVGPMWDCAECKYEEFFLTSFTVGDPAMIVDVPANTTDAAGAIIPGPKATKALFPDDPSNVHHAYLGDRVVFRNLHAGPKEHHIFHLHAHQWQFNPDDPQSNYLDGQAVGPGSGYTYEIAYGGSGNRNLTPGDSIFHCHFYPHFAQGMWELWRVHDTFEPGTLMETDPTDGLPWPADGARALPDGEIVRGTPIPGVVPMPGTPMAPIPDPAATIVAHDLDGDGAPDSSQFDANGDGIADILQPDDPTAEPATNPGYPWFTPGLVGHRPPTPALDLIDDGGLPRHVVASGPLEDNPGHAGPPVDTYVSRLDFNKVLHEASAIQLPEDGTPAEQVAMAFHAGPGGGDPTYDSFFPDGAPATGPDGFEVNGLPPVRGAPFADPCRAFNGSGPWTLDYPNGTVRTIKGANIEMPIVLNKVGWHFQQQRFEALWEDVVPTLTNARAPQPMIMRLNSTDCAEFHHANLVPNVYQLDDYQVRTPTDIIGQHIHLVKFDVMSADGSANGWNYEDGTLSPDEVRERIDAFNNGGGLVQLDGTTTTALAPEAHPYFGATGPDDQDWRGARTTVQRWYADPLLERAWDGGVGTVFTHDHYGPSTHQQVGLYSTLLVEPKGSTWRHNETGQALGTRADGGPTTWQAIIQPGTGASDARFKPHREFYFEFADFQHAYERNGGALGAQPNEAVLGPAETIPSYADFDDAINPSFRLPPPDPADIYIHPNYCPGTTFDAAGNPLNVVARPCPEAISADDPGTYALNFRNEPIGLRVFNGQVGPGAGQSPGLAGDIAHAYQSRTDRAIPELNVQPETNGISPYPPLTADVQPGDPWTPMLRVYMGDDVRIRVQVGAHEEEHNFTIPGLKWKQEPNSENSGWKNSEFFGIDEYFNLDVPIVPDTGSGTPARVDYIYTVGAELEGMWNGVWGVLRSYSSQRNDLVELPSNDVGRNGYVITNDADFDGICPTTAPVASFDVTAVRAVDVLDPVQGLVYNERLTTLRAPLGGVNGQGPLIDPTALMYVLDQDLVRDATGAPTGLKPGTPIEPLILRVNAGDCVLVDLTNALPPDLSGTEMPGLNALPPIVQKDVDVAVPGVGGILTFNSNDLTPSSKVGLTPQLLAFDPRTDGGFSTGLTTGRLVEPGATGRYRWYAGDVTVANAGVQGNRTRFTLSASPVEFGATGLMPADRIKGDENGFVGALIVEPQDSCWIADPGTRAQATVWKGARDGGGGTLTDACPAPPASSTDSFRDFVTIMQNGINLRYGGTVEVLDALGNVVQTIDCAADPSPMQCAVPMIAAEGPLGPTEDPQDSGQKAINYGADPPWFRLGITPDTPFGAIHRDPALKDTIPEVFSSFLDIGDGLGQAGDPQTEVFRASPNGPEYGRFRVVMPGGHARGVTYTLHGHQWQRQPYLNGSSEIGHSPVSEYYGTQEGINPTGHWDFVADLGGGFDVAGDYLWRDQASFGSFQGLWGLLRFDQTEPVAPDTGVTLPKYTFVDLDLLAGAFDLDGLIGASVQIVGGPSFGALVDPEGDGTYRYTSTDWPACADAFACQDSFTYTITDGTGSVSAAGTVVLTITNTAPVANNDTIIIKAPFTGGSVDVLLNDLDAEGDLDPARDPVVEPFGQPVDRRGNPVGSIADAVVDADGRTVTYTPPAGWSGVALIQYKVTDESGAVSNTALIRAAVNVDDITITSARYQPANQRWSISGTCNTPFEPGTSTPTTIEIFSGPTIEGTPPVIGTATCIPGDPVGTWSFSGTSTVPAPDPNAFNYVSAESALQGFYEGFPLTFAGQNNAPVATNDVYTTDEDTTLTGNVLANDSDADFDPLTAALVTGPAHGTLALAPTGGFTYEPDPDYAGTDSFTYQASDGQDQSAVASVDITITAVNDAPRAVDDTYVTDAGVPLSVPAPGILSNDSDVEGDPFTLDTTPLSDPANGIVALNGDGSFTYTPAVGFSGTDSFVYRICEDLGGPSELCGTATVTIAVGVNSAPTANDDAGYTTAQNTTLNVGGPGVLGNDTDPDNDPLVVASVNGVATNVGAAVALPSGSTVTVQANGSFTYVPRFNFVGNDSFTYVAGDVPAGALSHTATVTVAVKDTVTITSASYRQRQGRWQVQGTVSNTTSRVDVYLNRVAPADLLGAANVDAIDGSWSLSGVLGKTPGVGDTVIAVSSGRGESAPFPVSIRR